MKRVSGERPKPPIEPCGRCGLEVIVAHTGYGATMQVDPTPALRGTGNLLLYFEIDYTGQPVDGRQRVTNVGATQMPAEWAGGQPDTTKLWQEHQCTGRRARGRR